MSFFDDIPEPPQRPRPPRHVPPVWAGPPSDELPAVIAVGQFLHRSERMVMAAKSVEVFSTGCLFEVVWAVRRSGEKDSEWSLIADQCFNRGGYRLDAEGGRGGALRFGVALPDGRKTTASHLHPGMFDGSGTVAGPVLMMAGGGGGSANDDELFASSRFWLWPLPLGGDTRVVAQWGDLGMAEVSVLISGEQLTAAAPKVQKYWAGR
jgi:hypothetical protein